MSIIHQKNILNTYSKKNLILYNSISNLNKIMHATLYLHKAYNSSFLYSFATGYILAAYNKVARLVYAFLFIYLHAQQWEYGFLQICKSRASSTTAPPKKWHYRDGERLVHICLNILTVENEKHVYIIRTKNQRHRGLNFTFRTSPSVIVMISFATSCKKFILRTFI